MSAMNIYNDYIKLAGYYAVASELCRRGYYSQLTIGNQKTADLFIETAETLGRVFVRVRTILANWQDVIGIWGPHDLLVFVDYQNKTIDERPDFFVLSIDDWKKVVSKIHKKRYKDKDEIINEKNSIYLEPWDENPHGWLGCNVFLSDIENYKEAWPPPMQDIP